MSVTRSGFALVLVPKMKMKRYVRPLAADDKREHLTQVRDLAFLVTSFDDLDRQLSEYALSEAEARLASERYVGRFKTWADFGHDFAKNSG